MSQSATVTALPLAVTSSATGQSIAPARSYRPLTGASPRAKAWAAIASWHSSSIDSREGKIGLLEPVHVALERKHLGANVEVEGRGFRPGLSGPARQCG